MTKVIALIWRWALASVLTAEVCALLVQGPFPELLARLRGGDHIHVFYTTPLWCVPYLFCIWGLVTRRSWAVKFVALLGLFELVAFCVDAVVFGTLFVMPEDLFSNVLIVGFVALPLLAAETRKSAQPA